MKGTCNLDVLCCLETNRPAGNAAGSNLTSIQREVINVKKESIQPFVMGMAIGAIVLLVVVFWTGWVVTSGTARAEAQRVSEEAVLDSLAPICVAEFKNDPNMEQDMRELKAQNSWERGDYVKKKGWATMLGSQSPAPGLAGKCAEEILKLG